MPPRSFLADFHVHSTFSDGRLSVPELVDLYGRAGFGAIAITDHVAEENSFIGKAAVVLNQVLTEGVFPIYLELIRSEAQRAWDQYRMVVLAGLELSKNTVSNARSAHILAIHVSEYLAADGDPAELCQKIREQGGISVAAHPVYSRHFEKQTYYLWDRREELERSFDAWEVASGRHLFDEVRRTRLPKLASSDLHHPKQLESWKTRLECERHPEAILRAVRRQQVKFEYFAPSR